MKTRLFLVVWVVVLFIPGRAQAGGSGVISGVMRDATTGVPLPNANVVVKGTQRGDVSNYAGQFMVTEVPAGPCVVRASLLGYRTREIAVNVSSDRTITLDLELEEDEAIHVEEIVVSANRANVYPQVDVATQEAVHRSPKDAGDFFRTMPGTSSIRKGGTAMDPVVRGFRQDQINVQVDGGVKVWGACPNRMDPPTSHIQAEDLERIEIIKGPFTVRFGPPFGAVVNLVMQRPEQSETARLDARVEGGYESNWGGKRIRGTVTAAVPVADLYLSGGTKRYGDYRAGDGTEVESAFRMKDYSLKLGLNVGEQKRVQITNRGSYLRDVHYPALPMDAFVDDTHIYALDYASRSPGSFLSSFTAKGYLSAVHHIMGNDWKPTYTMLHAGADVRSQTFGGRAEAMLAPADDLLLYAGVDAYELQKSGDRLREYVGGPNRGRALLDTIWQDSHIRDIAGFLEARFFLGKKVTAIAGIRLDNVRVTSERPNAYFRSTFGGLMNVTERNVSAVAAVLYTPGPHVDMRFGVGRGVRTADLTERFIYIQPVGMDRYDYIGNPALRPEGNTQFELAAHTRIGPARLGASAYYSFLDQFISARIDSTVKQLSPDVLGVKRFVNISDARMAGWELSSSMPIFTVLRLDLAAAYTFGQNRDMGEALAEMPPLTGVALLHLQRQDEGAWAEVEARFVARQSRVSASFQEKPTPGFALYSLRGGIRFLDHLTCTVGLTNLFDRAYCEHLNRKSKVDGRPILEPGRVVSVSLRLLY